MIMHKTEEILNVLPENRRKGRKKTAEKRRQIARMSCIMPFEYAIICVYCESMRKRR